MIPPAKRGGRPREVDLREVLNAIFYVLSTGCQWPALPKDLPPKSTAHALMSRQGKAYRVGCEAPERIHPSSFNLQLRKDELCPI
jgi:transposase